MVAEQLELQKVPISPLGINPGVTTGLYPRSSWWRRGHEQGVFTWEGLGTAAASLTDPLQSHTTKEAGRNTDLSAVGGKQIKCVYRCGSSLP